MHEDPDNNWGETNNKSGTVERPLQPSEEKGNEQKSAVANDTNGHRPTSSGGPVHVYVLEKNAHISKPEETSTKYFTVRCGKNSGDFKKKYPPPSVQRGCSKQCAGYNKNQDTSSVDLTVCTSKKRNKLSNRIQRSKKKIQQISNQVQIRTERSLKKIQKIYRNIGAKRAMGFNCDLRNCPSTVIECSETSCAKPNMVFGKLNKLRGKFLRNEADESTGSKICDDRTCRDLKVLKDQSVSTNVEKETST